MKLYQLLLKKAGYEAAAPVQLKTPAIEDSVYNPIGCKLGAVVKIDALDFREHRFSVKEIKELSVNVGSETFNIVDYVLLSRPVGQDDFLVRLRVVPDNDSKSLSTHRSLILSLYDEFGYDDGFLAVLKDEAKKFVIDDNSDPKNVVHDEYWRVNDVGDSYNANVTTISGGTAGANSEVKKKDIIEFWDYSRNTDIDGVEAEEFVFVEKRGLDGWFQIWKGTEVNSENIEVF